MSVSEASSIQPVLVLVSGAPLVAAGICALINTIPDIKAIVSSVGAKPIRSPSRSPSTNEVRLSLDIGDPALPGNWVHIRSLSSSRKKGNYAVIGLHDDLHTLRAALRAVAAGTSYHSPILSPTPETRLDLSQRQREVALLAASGLSNAEIAQRLSLDVTTIKTHLTEVYRRTGIRRRSQIIGHISG